MNRQSRKALCLLFLFACILAAVAVLRQSLFPQAEVSRRFLAEGTAAQTELVTVKGSEEGPALFVVGGLHGDETSGWVAANRLKQEAKVRAGTLYIISPINAYGAEHAVRYTADNRDLNRLFPGNPEGDDSERLAAEVWALMKEVKPVLVMDLHEALPKQENRDYLGSSIIFTSMNGMEDLVNTILDETSAGTLCSGPFQFYGPGMPGSLNRTATEQLQIPALTVEVFRGDPMEQKAGDHLALVHRALRFYGME